MNDKYIMGIDPYDDDSKSKITIFKNGELIDLRTEEEIEEERQFWINKNNEIERKLMFGDKDLDKVNNPKELEYWRNIFPNKTDTELEEYRTKWSNENPKYLKFKNL